ncbi:MAG: glycosyltransferase family 4 protein [bacterium]
MQETILNTLQIVGDSKYGGATYLIIQWCKYLLDQRCQVEVLSTDAVTIREIRKIKGVRIREDIYIPRDIKPMTDGKAFIKLMRLFRHASYDVVHTYTATPGFLGRIAARMSGVPVILNHQAGWTVNDYSTLGERLFYTPLEYLATLASTKAICVSHAVNSQAHKLRIAPQSKLVTICNGIEPQPFMKTGNTAVEREALCKRLKISTDHVIIGNTGRLSAQKDNETLIRAMAVLKTILKDRRFTLVLVGDGPDRLKLATLVQSLKLTDQVRFLGFCQDIPSLLAGLDIFVNPSLWEGLSISLLEAMASARPIVTTSIPANAELIEHQVTGLTIPPKSPEHIAQAINRFVQDPEFAQKCARAARQRVVERYTIDRMFRETWDLYINLLKNKNIKLETRNSVRDCAHSVQ